jgi:hypothetical protein
LIELVSELSEESIKAFSIATIGNPMDNNDWHSTPGASATESESSGSKIRYRARLTPVAEEAPHAARSGWNSRWQHPLVKLIQERRGKARRS